MKRNDAWHIDVSAKSPVKVFDPTSGQHKALCACKPCHDGRLVLRGKGYLVRPTEVKS
jgi:hypothetical protein